MNEINNIANTDNENAGMKEEKTDDDNLIRDAKTTENKRSKCDETTSDSEKASVRKETKVIIEPNNPAKTEEESCLLTDNKKYEAEQTQKLCVSKDEDSESSKTKVDAIHNFHKERSKSQINRKNKDATPKIEQKSDCVLRHHPKNLTTFLWKFERFLKLLDYSNSIDEFFRKEGTRFWEKPFAADADVRERTISDNENVTLGSIEVEGFSCVENKNIGSFIPDAQEWLNELLELVVLSTTDETVKQLDDEITCSVNEYTLKLTEVYSKIFDMFLPAKQDLFIATCGFGYYELVSVLLSFPPFAKTETYLLDIFSHIIEFDISPYDALRLKAQWNQAIKHIRKNPSYWLIVDRTAMMRAAMFGQIEVVKLLMEKGFCVNKDSVEGFTPLLFATRLENEEMMQLLIDHGADVDGSPNTFSPLMVAAHRGNVSAVELLLRNGACAIEDEGVSILELATYKKHLDMVKFLLENRFALPFQNCQIKDSFVLAMQQKSTQLVDLFINAGIKLGGCELPASKTRQEDFYLLVCSNFLKNKQQSNYHVYKHFTPLMMCSLLGVTEIIQFLLEKGFDINERNTYGESALSVATVYGNYDVVNYLLVNGADLNNIDSVGFTPLMRAARFNCIKIVELLFEHGADCNKVVYKEGLGHNALSKACMSANLEIVLFLIQNGADVLQKISDYGSYLLEPLVYGHTEIVRALLKAEEEQTRAKKKGRTEKAASTEKIAKKSFQCSVLANTLLGETGDSPLILAARMGFTQILRILLSKGAVVDHQNIYGFTALYVASCHGFLFCVEALIKAGAKVNTVVQYKDIMELQDYNSTKMREEFFSYLSERFTKCQTEKLSRIGYTPLCMAAFYGHLHVVKKLVSNGADINPKSSQVDISPPLLMAACVGHDPVISYLLGNGADVNQLEAMTGNSALTCASQVGSISTVKLLIKAKAKVEHRSLNGLTPLMEAAKHGHVEVARILLSAKANVSAILKSGQCETALMIATEKAEYFICELLVKDSNINAKNKSGNSALWIACDRGLSCIVELLLNNGADVNATNNAGISPLLNSIKKGYKKIVELLLDKNAVLPSEVECCRCSAASTSLELKQSIGECIRIVKAAKDVYAERAKVLAENLLKQLDLNKSSKKGNREIKEKFAKPKLKSKRRTKKKN